MPIKRDIIYPVFLQCYQHATDSFWKNIFEDLAYGLTPYGTYIKQDFLSCSFKDKEFSYKIDEKKDSYILYNDIYNLLKNRLGILSHREKNKKRIDFNTVEDNIKNSRKTWSDIKKKNIKEILIEKYVIEMKNKYSLSINQAKYLLSIIFIALLFKIISNEEIHYNNNKIESIDGIEFKEKKIILKKDIYNIDAEFTPEIIVDKGLLSTEWEKYIKNLEKLSKKYN